MRLSLISAAIVAALVGYGASVAIVIAAATALGATPAQTASWLFAVCIAKDWFGRPVMVAPHAHRAGMVDAGGRFGCHDRGLFHG
jgi:Benzoate membrane transport protein